MQEKIQLIKNDGTKQDIKVVSLFSLKIQNEDKIFALLTFDELDPNGLVKILASEVGDANLIKIAEDSIWNEVKNVMRSIISGSNGDFSYVNVLDINTSFVVEDDFARVIAVQEAAKEALSKAYQDNKPAASEKVVVQEEEVVDPNQAIYPEGVGSDDVSSIEEVVPSEEPTVPDLPVDEPTFTPEEPTFTSDEPTFAGTPEENVVPEEPTFEAPIAEEVTPTSDYSEPVSSSGSEARDILIQEITAAVDKYLAEINKNNDLLKTNLSKMQEELNKINEAINTSN